MRPSARCWAFNIEGGCYAKTINITEETEPQIWHAIQVGSLCENVIVDPKTRKADYFDTSLTENGRVAYPVEFIDNAVKKGKAKRIPDVVIFLTADAFGVLPPISKLDTNAAMYHFMTGFTSKVAGTERGVKEPQPTFSSFFGEPFMPLDPMVYGKMLGEKIEHGGTCVYLINTGWTGGSYGPGSRIKLKYTRKMVEAAQSGIIDDCEFVRDERFNLDIPTSCPGVPDELLDARSTWANPEEYDRVAESLAQMFVDNAEKRLTTMSPEVRARSGWRRARASKKPELWGPGRSGALFVRGPARRFVRRGSVGRALCFRGKGSHLEDIWSGASGRRFWQRCRMGCIALGR